MEFVAGTKVSGDGKFGTIVFTAGDLMDQPLLAADFVGSRVIVHRDPVQCRRPIIKLPNCHA